MSGNSDDTRQPDSKVRADAAQAPTELADLESGSGSAVRPPSGSARTAAYLPSEEEFSSPDTRFGMVGTVLADRYRIEKRLGEGGMGIVYRAQHIGLAKDVAVKVLLPELSTIPGVAERFEREAKSLSILDHPGIVRVMDFGRTGEGLCYLVMDHVDGVPLSRLIRKEAPFSQERAVSLTRQILLALAHAHELGVVHRDLKPDNIMVVSPGSPQESIKILDFGIAKLVEEGEGSESSEPLTKAGMVFGTPEYLSPEQAAGQPELIDARSDLYTVGIILYEMVTGRRPFESDSRMALLNQHVTQEPPRPSDVVEGRRILSELEDVILKALAKEREDRFQSAMEFYEALSRLPLEQSPVSLWPGLPVPTASRTQPARRRRLDRWVVGVSLVALVAVVLAALFVLAPWRKRGAPRSAALPARTSVQKELDALLAKTKPKVRKTLEPVRAALLAAKGPDAIRAARKAVEKYPEDPVVRFFEGRSFALFGGKAGFLRSLAAYEKAVEKDPTLLGSSFLRDDLRAMLVDRNREVRTRALEFLGQHFGPKARPMIAQVAKQYDHYTELRDVLEVATKYHMGDAVDLVRYYRLMLKQSPRCNERAEAARQLRRILGPKALSDLREALNRKPWKYGRRTLDNDCIHDVLEQLIGELKTAPTR